MRERFSSTLKNKNMAYIAPSGTGGDARRVRRVAFILLDHFSMMAFTGAVDALVTTNLMKSSTLYEVLVVGDERGATVSDLGIEVSTDVALAKLDSAALGIDVVIVCGGLRVKPQATSLLRSRLKSAEGHGAILGGLWNGAYFLAEAGLLSGYQCAYHPDGRAMMAEQFWDVSVTSRSFIVDRNRLSCAGASSSLSMMLELVRSDCGNEVVGAVEEMLSCDKGLDSPDVSTLRVDRNHTLPEKLKISLQLMKNNIEEPLSIPEISNWVNLSRRQLERLFASYVSASPSRYYMELRLTRARQLLQQTNKPLAEVAVATGFVSISHFRNCFHQLFDITPGQFRKACQQEGHAG
ncbi:MULTISPECIES: GlxA family transcriptional regulator [unclassified Halomonas]|uniref:GlxA family transcriptional regulator n=1 Tax=unclassified Halomonas TaxID=2609666 RepID=UPI0020A2145B|nr:MULTISPECIES: GlxA family transcriptional regulator [unclassified Halomonas]MCP1314133.1 GlxA family transcriptional regulator [Halomonas sp. 707D7]MCP1328531.1 GlxA family transcriptional regulator [Halomonas sp. 707D4]